MSSISAYTGNIDKAVHKYKNTGLHSVRIDSSISALRISSGDSRWYNQMSCVLSIDSIGKDVVIFKDNCFRNCTKLSSITSEGVITDCGNQCYSNTDSIQWLWFRGLDRLSLIDLIARTPYADWPKNKNYYYGDTQKEEGAFVWPFTSADNWLSNLIGTEELSSNDISNAMYLIYQGNVMSTDYTYDGQNHQPQVISVILSGYSIQIGEYNTENNGDVYIDYCGDEIDCINAGQHYVEVIGKRNLSSWAINGFVKIPFEIKKAQIPYTINKSASSKYSEFTGIGFTVDTTLLQSYTLFYKLGTSEYEPTEWSTSNPTQGTTSIIENKTSSYVLYYKITTNDSNFISSATGNVPFDIKEEKYWCKVIVGDGGNAYCSPPNYFKDGYLYSNQKNVELSAVPDSNYLFDRWLKNDELYSQDSIVDITCKNVDETSDSYSVQFTKKYYFKFKLNYGGFVSFKMPAGTEEGYLMYSHTEEMILEEEPLDNYLFDGWYKNDVYYSDNKNITITCTINRDEADMYEPHWSYSPTLRIYFTEPTYATVRKVCDEDTLIIDGSNSKLVGESPTGLICEANTNYKIAYYTTSTGTTAVNDTSVVIEARYPTDINDLVFNIRKIQHILQIVDEPAYIKSDILVITALGNTIKLSDNKFSTEDDRFTIKLENKSSSEEIYYQYDTDDGMEHMTMQPGMIHTLSFPVRVLVDTTLIITNYCP